MPGPILRLLAVLTAGPVILTMAGAVQAASYSEGKQPAAAAVSRPVKAAPDAARDAHRPTKGDAAKPAHDLPLDGHDAEARPAAPRDPVPVEQAGLKPAPAQHESVDADAAAHDAASVADPASPGEPAGLDEAQLGPLPAGEHGQEVHPAASAEAASPTNSGSDLLLSAKALAGAWSSGTRIGAASSPSGEADMHPPVANHETLGLASADHRANVDESDLVERGRKLVSMGLGVEALGVLAQADATQPAVRALTGAAEYLAARPEAVQLFDASLDTDPEIAVWRSAAAAGLGRSIDTSARRTAMKILPTYPTALQRRLGPPLLDAMIGASEYRDAASLIDVLGKRTPGLVDAPPMQLRAGEIALAGRSYGAAARALARAAASSDFTTKVAAAKLLIDLAVAQGGLPSGDAVAALERQRPLWRGHPEEEPYLAGLAALQGQAGQTDQQVATLLELVGRANAAHHEEALAALRAVLLRQVNDDVPGARLKLMAYARLLPALAADSGPGARIKDLAEQQEELLGKADEGQDMAEPAATASPVPLPKPIEALLQQAPKRAELGSAPKSTSRPLEQPAVADTTVGLPPAAAVAGTPASVVNALAREIRAAREILDDASREASEMPRKNL